MLSMQNKIFRAFVKSKNIQWSQNIFVTKLQETYSTMANVLKAVTNSVNGVQNGIYDLKC